MTKEKIPFAERFNKFTGFVKNTLYLLGIVSIVCVAVYTTISKTFDIKIAELRNELNISINAVSSDFDNRIVVLENFVKNDIES